jgi:hypothetical protein
LSDAKAIRNVSEDDPSLKFLSKSLLSTLEKCGGTDLDIQTRGDLLATGDADLISRVDHNNRPVALENHQWRRLFKATNPDTLHDLLARKLLNPRGMVAHALAKTGSGNSSWGRILSLITEISTEPDTTLLSPHLRGLVSHAKITPHAATYLREQVAKFPKRYGEIAKCHLSQHHLYRPFLLHKAGLSECILTSNPPAPDCPARALFRNLQTSGHARLEIIALTSSLEDTIRNHENISAFLHSRMRH